MGRIRNIILYTVNVSFCLHFHLDYWMLAVQEEECWSKITSNPVKQFLFSASLEEAATL